MSAPSDVRLPAEVPHDPNSPTQAVARNGMILRTLVGSTIHGIGETGNEDRDEMGVCIEPPEIIFGHRQFEHYTWRTQPEGVCSGPGDVDLVIYSLRKYLRLATQGNPTVLFPLFVPHEHVLYSTMLGAELRGSVRDWILSRRVAARFAGYVESQRRGLLGLRSGGTRNQGRADIRARYGFDTKFAAHMVRLSMQGVELLTTGRIELPMAEPDRTWLVELRHGHHTKEEALERAAELAEQIHEAVHTSPLPPAPNYERLDRWATAAHRAHWGWS